MYASLILSAEDCLTLLKEHYNKENSNEFEIKPFHLTPTAIRDKVFLFFEVKNRLGSTLISESSFVFFIEQYFSKAGLQVMESEVLMDDNDFKFQGISLNVQKNEELSFNQIPEWLKFRLESLEFNNHVLVNKIK